MSKRQKKSKKHSRKRSSVKTLMDQGSYKEAAELLRKKQKAKHSDDNLRLLADCLAESKDYSGALEALKAVIKKTPADVLWQGKLFLKADDVENARIQFSNYISLQPNSAMGYYWLARTYELWRYCDDTEKRRTLLLDNLNKAISCEDCPEAAFLLLASGLPYDKDGIQQKVSVLRKGLGKHPDSDEVRLSLSGLYIWRLNLPNECLEVLKPLLDREQASSRALWRACEAYRCIGDYGKARERLQAICPKHIGRYRSLIMADIYLLEDKGEEALKELSMTIADAEAQDRILLLFSRANTFLSLGQIGPALDDARNAAFLALDSNDDFWADILWIDGEDQRYDIFHPTRRVCETFSAREDEFVRQNVDKQLRGAFLYCLYLTSTSDSDNVDAVFSEVMNCLDHPAISQEIAERLFIAKEFVEALRHHMKHYRWRYRRIRGDAEIPIGILYRSRRASFEASQSVLAEKSLVEQCV